LSDAYTDFSWATHHPANGESGEGIADLLSTLIEMCGDVHRICDLGCGNGYLAGRLARLEYEVVGVDASRSGIEVGRQHHPQVDFVCDNIGVTLAHKLNSGEFDLVVSSDVIEHLYRPSDLLEAAATLLRPKGHLLVCTPYHGYLKNLALSITGRMESHFTALWDGGHIKFFSVETLSELLVRHGFTDLRFSYYGRLPYLWKNMICHARKGD
jgi:2-polyprenyl-3-methyl-5-hydroxy-6-metoxy-1,4-benzoquinol methylase